MEDNRQIKIGAILAYGTIAFNILAGLIYTPWMIREIGQSDYGIYGLATSLIAMFSADFGLGSAATRFLSKYKAQNDEKKISQFMGVTLKLYLILDAIIFAILVFCFIFMSSIYKGLSGQEIEKLRIVFVIAGLFTTISFPFQTLNGVITACEKFVFQKLIDFINKAGTIIIMVALLMHGYGLYALVMVNAFVGLVIIVIKLFYLKKEAPIRVDWKYWDNGLLKEIFSFSVWATLITIAQNMIFNIMPTILGITSNTIEISKFTAASTIEGYVYTFTSVISGMFMPRMARMIYKNEQNELASAKEITDLMIKVGRIQLVIVGAIISIFIALGSEFVWLWLGEGFEGTYETILLMIIPTAVIAVQGIAETFVSVTGKIKYSAYGTMVTAVCAVVGAFLFSVKGGAIGAGIGVCIGNTLGRIVIMDVFYFKQFKLDIMRFYMDCFGRMLLPMITACILTIGIQHVIGTGGWILFFIKGMISAGIYCILIWFGALNAQEKELLKQPINYFERKNGKLKKKDEE
ncbi:oligosaccharide flippase family protein [Roseburia inulinivorans]